MTNLISLFTMLVSKGRAARSLAIRAQTRAEEWMWAGSERGWSWLRIRRRALDVVTFLAFLGVPAALWLPWWLTARIEQKDWYVKEGALSTLLQVVPATVVAVFIFAVGAVFVMV
jgi:hypothetical protein